MLLDVLVGTQSSGQFFFPRLNWTLCSTVKSDNVVTSENICRSMEALAKYAGLLFFGMTVAKIYGQIWCSHIKNVRNSIKWKNKIFPYYPEGIISNSIHISKLNLTSICEMCFEVFFAFGFCFYVALKHCITDFSCSFPFRYWRISRIQ